MKIIEELTGFIQAASKSRKISPNTAYGYGSALKFIESELTEEEKNSLDILDQRIDAIFNVVYQKNKEKFNISTIKVYKKRVKTLISNFKKYGSDPEKMASWISVYKPSNKVKTDKDKGDEKNLDEEKSNDTPKTEGDEKIIEFKIPLRVDEPNVKAVVLTPADVTKDELEKIKKYIDYLISISN